jgi:hypothetical protein
VGQSVLDAQPQLPETQWLLPVQPPHVAPFVPHCPSVVAVTHVPLPSQHPFGQLVELQLGVHEPFVQMSAAPQGVQEPPPVPHVALEDAWHAPSLPQQPCEQLDDVHATDVSPVPVSGCVPVSACVPVSTLPPLLSPV